MSPMFEIFLFVCCAGREANENKIYFRCGPSLNFVERWAGRRPYGPSAPRGALVFDQDTHGLLALKLIPVVVIGEKVLFFMPSFLRAMNLLHRHFRVASPLEHHKDNDCDTD